MLLVDKSTFTSIRTLSLDELKDNFPKLFLVLNNKASSLGMHISKFLVQLEIFFNRFPNKVVKFKF